MRWYYAAVRANLLGSGQPEETVLDTPWGKLGLTVVSERQVVTFAGQHHWTGTRFIWGTSDVLGHAAQVDSLTFDGDRWEGEASFLWRADGDETPDATSSSGYESVLAKAVPEDWAGGSFVPWHITAYDVSQGRGEHRRSTGRRDLRRVSDFRFRDMRHAPVIPRYSRGARRAAASQASQEHYERTRALEGQLRDAMTELVNRWLAEHRDALVRARRNRLAREIAKERKGVEYAEHELARRQSELGEKVIESLLAP